MSGSIDISELQTKLAQGTITLIEVLPAEHFARGHLPGALNLPPSELERRAHALLEERAREIVVYCSGPTCGNSHAAQRKLEAMGYDNVRVFSGGKAEWSEAGGQLEVAS